ncbi:DUF4174 domain-containing protein [Roseicyclus marinus]|uniref:DUF4174 domain-containing protein n=1 Tax=Roseicyclus marinus TaxID=2161673 RepID=UPI00240F36D7|nr:DUF4174 domain-containing protein [Roseicyclus marinus]MDG3041952.1 DUF4174 domain-containing protein [Roseicyclus marinus]
MRPIFLALAASLTIAGQTPAQTDADTRAIAAAEAGETGMEAVDPLEPRDATLLTLEDFIWVARPIIIFADSPNDPRVAEQLSLLADRPTPLLERDVVILVDTDPAAQSAIRTALRPRGFSIVIMQKDGAVGFRRPSPRDVREIIRGIDNFSFRQEELRMGQ